MIKKMLVLTALSAVLIACGGNGDKKADDGGTATSTESKKEDVSSNPDYQKGLALVGASDCFTCHKVSEVSTGPAYDLVAEKYTNAADTTIQRLGKKIIDGGAGAWGTVPMTPHPTVSQADAEQMMKYILLLKK